MVVKREKIDPSLPQEAWELAFNAMFVRHNLDIQAEIEKERLAALAVDKAIPVQALEPQTLL